MFCCSSSLLIIEFNNRLIFKDVREESVEILYKRLLTPVLVNEFLDRFIFNIESDVSTDKSEDIFSYPSSPIEFEQRFISKDLRTVNFEKLFKRFPNPMLVSKLLDKFKITDERETSYDKSW